MRKCPKCGYIRASQDNNVYSPEECPKCGTVYVKYEAYIAQLIQEREAETAPQRETPETAESADKKTCSQCGKGFDPRFFSLLPWKCPFCEGRYWTQEAQRKERKAWSYAIVAGLFLGLLIGVGSFKAHEAHKMAEIEKQEQAEKLLNTQKEQAVARLRAQQEQAEKLRAQKEQEAERLSALQFEKEKNQLATKGCLSAYRALKKIDALMLKGGDYHTYNKAVHEAKQELDRLPPRLDQTPQLEFIFDFYRESRDLWQIKRSRNVSKLCEEYRQIINHTELTTELKHKEACLRSCDSFDKSKAVEKGEEFYRTVKPFIDELQQKLWMEAAQFMKAYEARWGLP